MGGGQKSKREESKSITQCTKLVPCTTFCGVLDKISVISVLKCAYTTTADWTLH